MKQEVCKVSNPEPVPVTQEGQKGQRSSFHLKKKSIYLNLFTSYHPSVSTTLRWINRDTKVLDGSST